MTEFEGKKGKYFFGSVQVGDRGQMVIPLKARKIFGINAKDDAHVFGDVKKGLGIATNLSVREEELKAHDQYYGTARVGERGQIVIPQKARELLDINPGDLLLIFGDIKKGLGITKASKLKNFAMKLFQAFGGIEGIEAMDDEEGGDVDEEE